MQCFYQVASYTYIVSLRTEKLIAGPAGSNKYAVLQSLDLVCDSREEQQLWCRAVRNTYWHNDIINHKNFEGNKF